MRGTEPYKGFWLGHPTECRRINILAFQSTAHIRPLKEGGKDKS